MASLNQNIEIWAGDDIELDISLFEEDGSTPINVQGATINWAMSSVYDHGVELVSKSSTDPNEIEMTVPQNGQIRIFLGPDDTEMLGGEQYYHEAEVVTGGKSITVLTGIVKVNKTILH